jgi:hypothetical protein
MLQYDVEVWTGRGELPGTPAVPMCHRSADYNRRESQSQILGQQNALGWVGSIATEFSQEMGRFCERYRRYGSPVASQKMLREDLSFDVEMAISSRSVKLPGAPTDLSRSRSSSSILPLKRVALRGRRTTEGRFERRGRAPGGRGSSRQCSCVHQGADSRRKWRQSRRGRGGAGAPRVVGTVGRVLCRATAFNPRRWRRAPTGGSRRNGSA